MIRGEEKILFMSIKEVGSFPRIYGYEQVGEGSDQAMSRWVRVATWL